MIALEMPPTPAPLLFAEVRRITAPEASQGAAADANYAYAIASRSIGKYEQRTGQRVGKWRGKGSGIKHLNSCTVHDARLVCAASNFPEVPQHSTVETFDPTTMRHLFSRPMPEGLGSLTWLDWHDASWWACYANYDGKGGAPGLGNRSTLLVRYSREFAEQGRWLFPRNVLERMKPWSASGGAWGGNSLYVTGHSRKEAYVLRLPASGNRLVHLATVALPTPGQAISWGPSGTLWSIDRDRHQLVESRPSGSSK